VRAYYDSLLAGFVLGLSLGGLIAADSVLFALLMALGLWGGLLWARSAWLDARAALARVKGDS